MTSWNCWIRWTRATCGQEIGALERLPRTIAEIVIERGDAIEVDPSTLLPNAYCSPPQPRRVEPLRSRQRRRLQAPTRPSSRASSA